MDRYIPRAFTSKVVSLCFGSSERGPPSRGSQTIKSVSLIASVVGIKSFFAELSNERVRVVQMCIRPFSFCFSYGYHSSSGSSSCCCCVVVVVVAPT